MTWLRQLASAFSEMRLAGLCDIAIVTLVIYTFLAAVKRTRRSGLIFAGVVIVGLTYLAARKFNLLLTVALLQGFFTVILVALVIIFQEDLRYFFERLGRLWVERHLPLHKRTTARLPRHEVEILARTLGDLARAHIGALVVIRGKDPIARHLDGGEEVKGLVSEPLLKSIFDPHSPGHDGAVIIDGQLIDRLGCHLPLSRNLEKLPHSGTRHAAALGLSEHSDALCLVVSEERGTISIARRGDIWTVPTSAELGGKLDAFYDEVAPRPETRSWVKFFRTNYREKGIALGLAVALWAVMVRRSETIQQSFDIPVNYGLVPPTLMVGRVEPPTVRVTFVGQRKDLAFLEPNRIRLALDLGAAQKGRRSFPIKDRDLSYPGGLKLEDIEPRQVLIEIEAKPPAPR